MSDVNMRRRDVLGTALAAGATSILATDTTLAQDRTATSLEIVDTNVHLFQWPFRRLPFDAVARLATKLRLLGISQAWAGSFEGLLHRDVSSVNERLVAACLPHAELRPVGSVNLDLPDWEGDLRRCIERHQMHAIRLHPGYHGYTLTDLRFKALLQHVAETNVVIQIAVAMEDGRTQHPLVQVPDVDLKPLPEIVNAIPKVKVQILNARPTPQQLEALSSAAGIYFDTARTEGTDGVAKLVRALPPQRVMFGSHAPLLIPEAALIRVAESRLEADELQRLMSANAGALALPS